MDFFKSLQTKYVEADLVTYTELILPLPGETYDSFKEGVDNLLDSSQHSGLIVYNCSIMPNAEMGDANYQKKHKIKTIDSPIFQAHSSPQKEKEEIDEYPLPFDPLEEDGRTPDVIDIVIEYFTSTEEYEKCAELVKIKDKCLKKEICSLLSLFKKTLLNLSILSSPNPSLMNSATSIL